ncbi:MAG TPA: hypothetical protein VIO57_03065 [Chloroflexota bacterium]|jgi:hypothetical protein
MVRVVTLIGVGILCSAAWLGLLIVTGFAAPSVGVGLLGALFITGTSAHPDRTAK